MGLGRQLAPLLERNITYDVTNTITGAKATHTIITDGGPGMYPGWNIGQNYRGGMGIPAAWRLALLIANQLGRIPWQAFREVQGSPPVKILPPPPLLARPVGKMDTALGAFRSWGLDRLWHGNAVGVIVETNAQGWPTAATPVSAEFVQVALVGFNDPQVPASFAPGEIAYLINGKWYHQAEVIHFKGPCAPGALRGMGVLEEHFALMDRSRKLDEAASSVDSSAVPTGVLKSLNPDLSATEAADLKSSWQNSQRTRSVAVLNPLTEFVPIAWNPTETQLLESRNYSLIEWANIFGINVTYAGGQNASRVYANIVDQGMDLLRFGAVGDIIAEFEATLTELLPRGNYVKGNVDHLLRADTKGRYEAHAIGIAAGFITRDEVRELEERPALTTVQKAEIIAMAGPKAPAPGAGSGAKPASNQAGTGSARPKLAVVRALAERAGIELADWQVARLAAELEERGRHSFDPNQPRDPDGQWSDGVGGGGTNMLGMPIGGGPGRRRRPEPDPEPEPPPADDDDDDSALTEKPGDIIGTDPDGRPIEVGRNGAAGVRRPEVPKPDGYGGGEGTGLKRYKLNTSKYCPTCGGKAQDPQWSDSGVVDYSTDGAALWDVGFVPEKDDEPYHDPDDEDYVEDRARPWFPGEALARAAAGEEALHDYWTSGPGLARWVTSRTPWRTLRKFLSKYMSGTKLDSTASAWYRDVFGYLPQDK